ncbi:hypothetical protein VO71_16770, partial [Aeromonas salmonicida subsp. smithia]
EAENPFEHQKGTDALVGVELTASPFSVMVLVKPVIHGLGINPESERATVDQRPVVLRPIGDGVKRFTHDADLRGMVVLRSLGFQLVPFKLHRFRKQRPRKLKQVLRSDAIAGYSATTNTEMEL